ncbi:hypothetical protein LTR01_002418 [Friedmanniomyces endolithicus]|nr:hypothetical protein LTR01_002418 [Friedmanniomyces endolithicus]KAK0827471.1 hypothetical protein LTR73_005710 [Friedmanniomyces endolithicus]
MHLINTTTLGLHEFVDVSAAPRYAIVSHRWGDDEVSHKDYLKGRQRSGNGLRKIEQSCQRARMDGHDWLWIDSCCMDKRSSASLNEAINSMFSYYARATVCYAYLYDVEMGLASDVEPSVVKAKLAASCWFARGWTLQELIAPRTVQFFDCNWSYIGAKSSDAPSLNQPISEITRIPEVVLRAREAMFHYSIAQRFSWASRRTTTRVEDMSYCLLGLFDINMPLIYGEGWKAFSRLQKEILTRYDDDSIFAWRTFDEGQTPNPYRRGNVRGLLARMPAEFANASQAIRSIGHNRPPCALTNRGMEIRIPPGKTSGAYRDPDDHCVVHLYVNCISWREGGPYVLVLRYLPHCRHYGRVALLQDVNFKASHSQWHACREDEVLYVHLTWMDAMYCSTQPAHAR